MTPRILRLRHKDPLRSRRNCAADPGFALRQVDYRFDYAPEERLVTADRVNTRQANSAPTAAVRAAIA